jgi:hypothetical protein
MLDIIGKFGSIFKNLKRSLVVIALVSTSSSDFNANANESFYKMRIHKNFLKRLIDNNWQNIIMHLEV